MGLGELPDFLKRFSKPKKLDFSVYKKEAKSVEKWVKAFVKDGEKYLNDPKEYSRNKLVIMLLVQTRNFEQAKDEIERLEKEIIRLKNRLKNLGES